MFLFLSFVPLFLAVILLQLSTGAIGPLDALSGIKLGFSEPEIGLLGSAHFFGFFLGCWWAPRLMGSIGHSRSFAVFATCGAMGVLAHTLTNDSLLWALMRIMTGMCIAGSYTVIEAWMQAMLNKENRGRTMGAYRIVDIGASAAGQLMIGVLEPADYLSYNILALICCACIFPLTLSTRKQPKTPTTPRLRPWKTMLISPLGATGVIVAGLTSASFRTVSPLYGEVIGLSSQEIAYFLATVLLGGALAQLPAGWAADKFDRRWVLIILSAASILVCTTVALSNNNDLTTVLTQAFLFGAVTFPIFSVASAHTNDFSTPEQSVETNASLMFLFAMGAIFAPLSTSSLIGAYGAPALFYFIAVVHALLVIISLWRMFARPTVAQRTEYAYIPRTTFTISKLLRRQRKPD